VGPTRYSSSPRGVINWAAQSAALSVVGHPNRNRFFTTIRPFWPPKLRAERLQGRWPSRLTHPRYDAGTSGRKAVPLWLTRSGTTRQKAMTTQASLIDELERALTNGNDAQRNEMLARITDLFLAGANRYSVQQIGLFDEVIAKLATAIETKARAKLSIRLADVPTAPVGVVRMLAFDDDIDVARPVLKDSERLTDPDLVANASSKSQQHLAAISERKSLSEAVTDVLVSRGNRDVVHSVVRNAGARFSDAAFRMLVKRSSSDDALAMHVGARPDLPRQHFLRLLEEASATVRGRLAAENPTAAAAAAVEGVLSEVVGGIRSETRKISSQYATAAAEVGKLKQDGHLGEAEVYKFARENRFEESAVSLSMMCGVELDAVERALHDRGHEIALILAKLAGFSSTTAKAILLLKTADRGISAQDLDNALRTYEKLQVETARRVLGFYRTRLKTQSRSSSPTLAAAAG
jgi:uncharacterized protein (DUF2336 family)